jgi:hypothetical protein
MPGGTVRIRKETQTILRELAVSEGKPMQTILALALEEYRRQRFLKEAISGLSPKSTYLKEWAVYLERR